MTVPALRAQEALPQVRHVIGNALTDYCTAVDRRDSDQIGELLGSARVVFRGDPVTDEVSAYYERAFSSARAQTQHMYTNLAVALDDTAGHPSTLLRASYRATYQRWEHRPEGPACVALGRFEGAFRLTVHGRQQTGVDPAWIWATHEVTTNPIPPAQHQKENHR